MGRRFLEVQRVALCYAACCCFSPSVAFGGGIAAQGPAAEADAATTAKAQALIDLTGYWVSMVNEDWRWRMMTPAKGDYASVPLNAEGKRVAGTWDPAKDEREGNQCRAYGAGNIMRIPERLHITWENDNTLRMDTDAGMQTRLFHFDGSKWKGGATTAARGFCCCMGKTSTKGRSG